MDPLFLAVVFVVLLTIVFDFSNGFNDAANIVATMIASRSLSPESALVIAAVCEFVGPLTFGTAVANTIGRSIVDPAIITTSVVAAALLGAIAWNFLSWWRGIPSSSSHALVGGLAGSVLAGSGAASLRWSGFGKIVAVLVLAPLVSMAAGFLAQKFFIFLARGCTPSVNKVFRRSQIFSSMALALSHGANDAQKGMGLITMVLIAGGFLTEFRVPTWAIVACATAMAVGTASGGWRIIRTVGNGIYKLRPVHAFSTQFAASCVIFSAALMGGPVSTSHVVSSGIMGVGSADRIRAVRWHKAREIVLTWIITIPCSACLAALLSLGLARLTMGR